MALSDVIKKKQETGDGKSASGSAKNILDDVRIVIAVIIVACIALIVLTVFGTKSINDTLVKIDSVKQEYKENQAQIANLKALQSKSEEYKAQNEQYDAMLSKRPLDQQQIMIDMEADVEAHNCMLTNVTFGEQTNTGLVNQIQVTLSVTGAYADIMSFAHDTVNGTEIKRIDSIIMKQQASSDDKEPLKTANITIVLFQNPSSGN